MKPDDKARIVMVERDLLFDLLAHCIAVRRQLDLIDTPSITAAAAAAAVNVNHMGAKLAELASAPRALAVFAPPPPIPPVRSRAATVDMRPPGHARGTQPPARPAPPVPPSRVFRDRPFLPQVEPADDDAFEDSPVITSAPRPRSRGCS